MVGEFVDTSAWVALFDVNDTNHAAAGRHWTELQQTRIPLYSSFTDCTSFVVMRRLGLYQAFCFDDDFVQLGFTRKP